MIGRRNHEHRVHRSFGSAPSPALPLRGSTHRRRPPWRPSGSAPPTPRQAGGDGRDPSPLLSRDAERATASLSMSTSNESNALPLLRTTSAFFSVGRLRGRSAGLVGTAQVDLFDRGRIGICPLHRGFDRNGRQVIWPHLGEGTANLPDRRAFALASTTSFMTFRPW